jgi:hypothetical protein
VARRSLFITIAACCILACAYPPCVSGQVRFDVSNVFSAVYYSNKSTLKYREWETVELYDTPYHDRYVAYLSVSGGPLRVIVMDRRDVETNNLAPHFLMDKIVSTWERIKIPVSPSNKGLALACGNGKSSSSIKLSLTVYRIGDRPPERVEEVKEWLERPIRAIERFYYLPSFAVRLRPCGYENAYSDPDVVICSELFAELFEKNLMSCI